MVGLTGARFGGAAGRRRRETALPRDDIEIIPSGAGAAGDHPVVGFTGARFGPQPAQRRALHAVSALTTVERDSAGVVGVLGLDTAKPDGAEQDLPDLAAPDTAEPAVPGPGMPPGSADWIIDDADWDGSEQTYTRVRPYAWTKGRTRARQELAVEALISASGGPLDPTAGPEHHAIVQLCRTPRSVAEVAALLSVPLGVARVLLGDLADSGSVRVHRTAGNGNAAPELALMQRVLTCLQRL